MGTVQNGNADVFRTIVAAVPKHKATQLVLSIGNVLRPEQIGPLPKNAFVVNHAPQLELLKKASVCITHAGFNTVLEALTQGVPQVSIQRYYGVSVGDPIDRSQLPTVPGDE
jgi:zeaxanthin glucosyltransferase